MTEEITTDINREISEIATLLLQGQCRLFIGAGVPKEGAGLPDYSGLAAQVIGYLIEMGEPDLQWLRDLIENDRLILNLNPAQVFELLQNEVPQPHIKSAIEKALTLKEQMGPVYEALGKLAIKQRPTDKGSLLDYIYTTNFDLSLERQFGGKSTTVSPERIDELQRTIPIKVVHLNGALGDNILRVSEREDLLSTTAIWGLSASLGIDLVAKRLIFVGYSLQDFSIKLILLAVNEIARVYHSRHWLINDFSSDHLVADNRNVLNFQERLWGTRKIKLMNLTASTFFQQLLERVTYNEKLGKVAEIAKGKRISEGSILEKSDRLRNKFSVMDANSTLDIVEAMLPDEGDS